MTKKRHESAINIVITMHFPDLDENQQQAVSSSRIKVKWSSPLTISKLIYFAARGLLP
jgi:hypothetical protein